DQNTIDLWFCTDQKIVDASLLDRYYQQLEPHERQQERRFYFEQHRRQYLITRAMVRNILSIYIKSVSPQAWQFSQNEFGKPWVSGPVTLPVRFNVSHTAGIIVVAITKNREIGVDVESTSRRRVSL